MLENWKPKLIQQILLGLYSTHFTTEMMGLTPTKLSDIPTAHFSLFGMATVFKILHGRYAKTKSSADTTAALAVWIHTT